MDFVRSLKFSSQKIFSQNFPREVFRSSQKLVAIDVGVSLAMRATSQAITSPDISTDQKSKLSLRNQDQVTHYKVSQGSAILMETILTCEVVLNP